MTLTGPDPAAFVLDHTRVAPVPLVPSIRLHQADDAFMLWETTEHDLAREGLALPFWAFPWAGGIALARYVLDHPALVEGRRVLDLGAGSGLVAIAAGQAGAAHVTASDIDPLALAAVALNAALNDVEVARSLEDLLADPHHPLFDDIEVILAGDIAYERSMAERVFGLLVQLSGRGIDVYVGDPGRAYLPRTGLEQVGSYEVPVTRALEDADVKVCTVWRLLSDDDPRHVDTNESTAQPVAVDWPDRSHFSEFDEAIRIAVEAARTASRETREEQEAADDSPSMASE